MKESVEILRMAYGKGAVAKLRCGKTVFVQGGVPGETVDVEVIGDFDRYAIARIVSRKVKADEIIGADWADLPYEMQITEKENIVFDALVRSAKFEASTIERVLNPCVECENEWNYRNKIELAYANNTLGMNLEGSNKFCEVKSFPLAKKQIENAPKALAGALKFALHGESCGLFRVGIRFSEKTSETQVALWTEPGWFARHEVAKVISDTIDSTSIVRIIAEPGKARKIKQVEVLSGNPTWSEYLNGYIYAISAPSFFQVNSEQAEKLQSLVLEAISKTGAENVADLYCGTGTFTLPLAKAGFDVTGVELAGSSTKDLSRNLKRNRLVAGVICDEVERALPKMKNFDACVLDPPKCGLNKRVLRALLDKNPQTIVYVSCDPMTLARDLKTLADAGYTLTSVTPVDMFAQTHHIETVAVMGR